MADNPDAPSAHEQGKEVAIKDAPRAPVIYFEVVPTLGFNHGIVNLMLAVGLVLPTRDGSIVTEITAAAHLRCNIAAAIQLRDSIDKALLIASPVPEGKAN
jgi:hypothetical protein